MTPADQMKDVRERLEASLDHYRALLHDSLDGLSEDEARRSLVPSKTTLLGLVKHVTYVEKFYFKHCVTGRPLQEIGVASTPDRSFDLAAAGLELDEIVTGRVEQPVLTLYLRTLHDLIHHCGHADILREQILASR